MNQQYKDLSFGLDMLSDLITGISKWSHVLAALCKARRFLEELMNRLEHGYCLLNYSDVESRLKVISPD
jgi:hypothetical protein